MTETEMSVTQWFQSQAADFYGTGIQKLVPWHKNVSIPEVIMLKNSSKLAVSVPIILNQQTLSYKSENKYRIEREKFYPGSGLEPGPLAFPANARSYH